MKKSIAVSFATVCFALTAGVGLADHAPGNDLGTITVVEASHADVKSHNDCLYCGMDREKFSHSRMLVTYADGTSVGTCSINCVVIELKAHKGKTVRLIEVGDYATKKLIDAEKAIWVIGGDKRGVMTSIPKWAFAKKEAAEEFIGKHNGTLATFKEALAAAEKN